MSGFSTMNINHPPSTVVMVVRNEDSKDNSVGDQQDDPSIASGVGRGPTKTSTTTSHTSSQSSSLLGDAPAEDGSHGMRKRPGGAGGGDLVGPSPLPASVILHVTEATPSTKSAPNSDLSHSQASTATSRGRPRRTKTARQRPFAHAPKRRESDPSLISAASASASAARARRKKSNRERASSYSPKKHVSAAGKLESSRRIPPPPISPSPGHDTEHPSSPIPPINPKYPKSKYRRQTSQGSSQIPRQTSLGSYSGSVSTIHSAHSKAISMTGAIRVRDSESKYTHKQKNEDSDAGLVSEELVFSKDDDEVFSISTRDEDDLEDYMAVDQVPRKRKAAAATAVAGAAAMSTIIDAPRNPEEVGSGMAPLPTKASQDDLLRQTPHEIEEEKEEVERPRHSPSDNLHPSLSTPVLEQSGASKRDYEARLHQARMSVMRRHLMGTSSRISSITLPKSIEETETKGDETKGDDDSACDSSEYSSEGSVLSVGDYGGKKKKWAILSWFCKISVCISLTFILLLVLVLPQLDRAPRVDEAPTISPMLPPNLETIRQKGKMSCLVANYELEQGIGFSLDLCRALAAAIFNGDVDQSRVTFPSVSFTEQWGQISDGTLDISLAYVTSTMERDVLQPNAGEGMAFSTPYIYSGTIVGGEPEDVACAEARDTQTVNCRNLVICFVTDTTTEYVVKEYLNVFTLIPVSLEAHLFSNFTAGNCNLLAGEPQFINEKRVRDQGYDGDYVFGTRFFSREPLAMVTRQTDPVFGKFVEAVFNALVAAEALGITQDRANEFPTTNLFGPGYERIFQHAISAVGNYGELYGRHAVTLSPRSSINSLHDGENGLLYAHPFGDVSKVNALVGPLGSGMLESVKKDEVLVCGILSSRPWLNDTDVAMTGLDMEYCRAISVAIFEGSTNQVAVIQFVTEEDAFSALSKGVIDVFTSAQYTMENKVKEPSTGHGFTLSTPYFYDSASGDAYSLATIEDDPQWSDFVQWVLWSTIYAEEQGISSSDADLLPLVGLFGEQYLDMFQLVSREFGNYGDMYERSEAEYTPRGGKNRLNTGEGKMLPWLGSFGIEG